MTTRTVSFEVLGIPAPQGSTRAFVVGNRAVTTNKGSPKHMAWRDSVAAAAQRAAEERVDWSGPLDEPLTLTVTFRFPMPASRSKADRAAGECPKLSAPDLDKLVRSVGDALQAGGLIRDDSRIVQLDARKIEVVGWTGAIITLRPWTPFS